MDLDKISQTEIEELVRHSLPLQLFLAKRLDAALKEREVAWKLETDIGDHPQLFVENLLEELEAYRNFCDIVKDLAEAMPGERNLRNALKDALLSLGIPAKEKLEPLDEMFPERYKAAKQAYNPEEVFLTSDKDQRTANKCYIRIEDRLAQLKFFHISQKHLTQIKTKLARSKKLERKQRGKHLYFLICSELDQKLERLAKR